MIYKQISTYADTRADRQVRHTSPVSAGLQACSKQHDVESCAVSTINLSGGLVGGAVSGPDFLKERLLVSAINGKAPCSDSPLLTPPLPLLLLLRLHSHRLRILICVGARAVDP
jgi:hypothetical protein